MALETDTTRIWSDTAAEIHQVVVGPMDNNVYVLRCRSTGDAVLIDAANEHDLLLELARSLGVRQVLETHGHWDHIQAVTEMRDAGYSVGVTSEDASMLPSYDEILADDELIEVGDLRLRTIHTPGHTPGSMCFAIEGTPVLFSGDTLFPGGPGNTTFEGGASRRSSSRSNSGCSAPSVATPSCCRDTATTRRSAPRHHILTSGSSAAGELQRALPRSPRRADRTVRPACGGGLARRPKVTGPSFDFRSRRNTLKPMAKLSHHPVSA